ncbi:MAG: ATP-binding protein [Anaerolineaceae bacterium]
MEKKNFLEGYPAFGQIMQNINQVVWLYDRDTDAYLYVGPAFEVVWGRPRESLIADPSTLIKSIHPEDRVKVLSVNLDDNHRSMDLSYRILRPDGSLRWISAHMFLINEESTGAAYQVCVAEDITDQSQVDLTLRKALDRSREQSNLSRRMSLAHKPEAVLNILMSASELRASKRAFVLFFETPLTGHARHIEVIASWTSRLSPPGSDTTESLNEVNLFDELALTDLFHPSKSVVVTDIAKNQRLTPEVRVLLQEERIRTLVIFPLVALGKWLGSLLVFFPEVIRFESIELRHIKVLVDQATTTLNNLQLLEIEAESRHEAERANEIKTEFLAMISHELRTPLTSIIGFTTTLLAEDVVWEPDEQVDFIQTIQQEANRLQELIDHLLDLSRLEAGRLAVSLKPHSLEAIIEDALPQLQTLTIGRTLKLQVPADLPPVNVDARRIAQVLVNLVRNASTYSPEGTEIHISAGVRKGVVQINISDQGPGIPPAEHKKVFKAFQRGSDVEEGLTQGAGLGLAICKGLVEGHGGRIWIKKKNSPGATISFTIPLIPLQSGENYSKEGH